MLVLMRLITVVSIEKHMDEQTYETARQLINIIA